MRLVIDRLPAGWPSRVAGDVADALSFFTRLPVRSRSADDVPFSLPKFAWAAPVAGAVVGLIGAAAGAAAALLALPTTVRAVAAVGAMILATGALHEDGFADCLDGFGGGQGPQDKLAIMRDSRLGTYGVIGLALGLIARISMIGMLFQHGLAFALSGLVISEASARLAALAPLALLEPARADGAGASAGRLPIEALVAAGVALAIVAAVSGMLAFGVIEALFACLLAAAAAWLMAMIARRQIGGQTGDVAGAAAFCGGVAALAGLLVNWRAL